MPDEKKVFVSIYCKLPEDAFSREMVNQMATGKEIYDFLMKDAGLPMMKMESSFLETATSGISGPMSSMDVSNSRTS